jgi:predicted deacetylase
MASYLLRFDDICPTMNWNVWGEIEQILVEAQIKPILAVIPDNQDPQLYFSDPNPHFWDHVRRWQQMGWTIGLHGYQHMFVTDNPGIIGLNKRSEFAGVTPFEQAFKLQTAISIFGHEGVHPDVWIAPAHSFDRITVELLKVWNIYIISDGLFFYPYTDDQGMIWIPQQIWGFIPIPFGVWTVCFHHNTWGQKDVSDLRRNINRFAVSITSISEVFDEFKQGKPTFLDLLISKIWLFHILKGRAIRSQINW